MKFHSAEKTPFNKKDSPLIFEGGFCYTVNIKLRGTQKTAKISLFINGREGRREGMSEKEVIVSMKDICKSFPGVKALDHVQFELRSGEVMALLGENGAGKSTLMKILSGVYTRDSGSLEIFLVPAITAGIF